MNPILGTGANQIPYVAFFHVPETVYVFAVKKSVRKQIVWHIKQ